MALSGDIISTKYTTASPYEKSQIRQDLNFWIQTYVLGNFPAELQWPHFSSWQSSMYRLNWSQLSSTIWLSNCILFNMHSLLVDILTFKVFLLCSATCFGKITRTAQCAVPIHRYGFYNTILLNFPYLNLFYSTEFLILVRKWLLTKSIRFSFRLLMELKTVNDLVKIFQIFQASAANEKPAFCY